MFNALGRLLHARFWPILLIAYVCVLAVATHWPRLRFDGPVPRSDLYIHLLAFGMLGGLVVLSAWFGRTASLRNVAMGWLAAMLYAAVDESTQAIPGLGRTAAVDDFLANTAGITLGVVGAGVLARLAGRERYTSPVPAAMPQTSTDS